jgi:pSer/pThr/pTyr-binding forkhead associated (FHA) protein
MKAIGKGLLCALGGTLGWLLTAPLFPRLYGAEGSDRAQFFYTLLVCVLIGGGAGYWQGRQKSAGRGALFSALLGLIFGAVGGFLGSGIGSTVTLGLFGPRVFESGSLPAQIIARSVAFTIWGAGLGLGVGVTLRSTRGAISGLVGGALGGMLAGATFDVISEAIKPFVTGPPTSNMPERVEIGVVSRAALAAVLGFGIGLFTALVDLATRRAWVRLELGRNEGREWPIDSARTMIGRDERAHVPLFADPGVPALAAVIERHGPAYMLVDPGSPIGVGLNGFRVTQPVPLSPNDLIQVGSLNLRFDMKQGAARQAAEGRAKAQPLVPITGGAPIAPQPTPTTPFQPMNVQTVAMQQTMMTAPAVAPASFVLVAQSGPMAGQRFPITGPTEIGRDASGLRLSWDTQASRRHAMIAPAAGGVQVTDLNSTNGTLVNGQRVDTVLLTPGQSVQIGSTTFVLQSA